MPPDSPSLLRAIATKLLNGKIAPVSIVCLEKQQQLACQCLAEQSCPIKRNALQSKAPQPKIPQPKIPQHTCDWRCLSNSGIVALVPHRVLGFTRRARPTFLLYCPATAPRSLVFNLRDARETFHYQTAISLPPRGDALVALTLPDSAPALQPGLTYRWYPSTPCGSNSGHFCAINPLTGGLVPTVSHWVRRFDQYALEEAEADEDPDDAVSFAALNHAIAMGAGYDALALAIALQGRHPGDRRLARAWAQLEDKADARPQPLSA